MDKTKIVPSLELIIAKIVKPLLRIHHLNRDVVIGWIGDRGSGKSIGAAVTGMLDWGVEGDILRSNMKIACDIAVSDKIANLYGLDGGSVHYESEELNKHKFLNFSPDYFRSVFVIDEINVWLADARRTMSTQNLLADDVTQQLRKWQSPLFYSCIHEMFVDSRIRDMTDLFIKTSDTALTEHGLRNKQRQGIKFEWMLYPMTRKFTGHTYAETKRSLGPIPISGKMLWDIINTDEHQERKKYKPEEEDGMPVSFEEDPANIEQRSKWGWLTLALIKLHDEGIKELEDNDLWEYLQLQERKVSPRIVGVKLREMNIIKYPGRPGRHMYPIEDFDLGSFVDKQEYKLTTT